jgi:hypothetical protein
MVDLFREIGLFQRTVKGKVIFEWADKELPLSDPYNCNSFDDLSLDADMDLVPDVYDNCPSVANHYQEDIDGDGIGDACDPCTDVDHDGICSGVDKCLTVYDPTNTDSDNDGIGDVCDFCTDVDNDTYCNYADCNDNNNAIHPGATEICDGIDNNCINGIDEDFFVGRSCVEGVGDCTALGAMVCSTDGLSSLCNAVPGTPSVEVCDSRDNNCDGQTDEGYALNQSCAVGIGACAASGTTVCTVDGLGTECGEVPGTPAPELCDGLDNDCDGQTDEDFALGQNCVEGLGECAANGTTICSNDGQGTACNAVPGTPSPEICDGLDNDCNGLIDFTFFADTDNDLYGDVGATAQGCSAPAGYVANSADCDDTNNVINPDASEVTTDNIDNNCDGLVNEGPLLA